MLRRFKIRMCTENSMYDVVKEIARVTTWNEMKYE